MSAKPASASGCRAQHRPSELFCAILYIIPKTSLLGAVLLTGLLGAALAANLRIDNPLFSHTLFSVYLGVFAWAGLWLREPKIRDVFPFT
jgi:hypothetical protein